MMFVILINIVLIVYSINVFFYNKKGLWFLLYTKDVIIENNDEEELKELTETHIPEYIHLLEITKTTAWIVYMILHVNAVMLILTLFPSMQDTFLWYIMIPVIGTINAFNAVCFRSFAQLKIHINAICESYDVLIKSYEHVKEYENNNDNTD